MGISLNKNILHKFRDMMYKPGEDIFDQPVELTIPDDLVRGFKKVALTLLATTAIGYTAGRILQEHKNAIAEGQLEQVISETPAIRPTSQSATPDFP